MRACHIPSLTTLKPIGGAPDPKAITRSGVAGCMCLDIFSRFLWPKKEAKVAFSAKKSFHFSISRWDILKDVSQKK